MTDFTPPNLPESPYQPSEWLKNLGRKKDPEGVPVETVKRLTGPVELALPYWFAGDSYTASIRYAGMKPVFVDLIPKLAGWATWRLTPPCVVILASLDRQHRVRLTAFVIESGHRPEMSALIHRSKEGQRRLAHMDTRKGGEPDAHS